MDRLNDFPKAIFRSTVLFAALFWCSFAMAQQARFSAKAASFSHPDLSNSFVEYELYRFNVYQLYNQIKDQDQLHFRLQLGDQHDWNINLAYNDLRSPNFQEVAITDAGFQVLPWRRAITYAGFLNDQHAGEARFSITEQYVMGMVNVNGQPFYMEPLWHKIPDAPEDLYVVYKPQNVLQDGPLECGSEAVQKKRPMHDEQEEQMVLRGGGMCLEVDFLTAATFDMFSKFGSVAAVNDHIQTITNMVEPYYAFASLDYVIVQQFVPATAMADPFTASVVAGDLLNSIESWAGGGGISTHDIGQLWVNRDIVGCNGDDPDTNTSLIGCANIGVVCNSNRYNVCEDFTSNLSCLAVLSTHELGHNWDARHDDANGNDDNIMFPSLNCGDPPLAFGGTEQAVILAHVASRGCLSNCGTPSNDLCAGAMTLGCGDSEAALLDVATSTDAPSACPGGGTPNVGVWFRFVGNGEVVTVSTATSSFDTQLNVYEGSCGSLTCVGGDDDGGPGTTSEFTFCALLGNIYYIYLDGFGGQVGSYFISISCTPDAEDPVVTCPANQNETTDPGVCGADVILPAAMATDNCEVSSLQARFRGVDAGGFPLPGPAGDWSAFMNDPSGFFEVGRHEIQWRALDPTGNDDFCSMFLEVVDDELPMPVCIDPTVDFNGEEEITLFPADYYDAMASSDNCGNVIFVGPASVVVSCEDLGMIIPVLVTVEDDAGNEGTCTANITVDGLPCGWMNTFGIGCTGTNAADYDVPTETFFLDSDGCVPGFPYTGDDLSFIKYELCGDGEIIAEVTDIAGGQGFAGIMMREDLDEGSPKVSIATNRVNKIRKDYRVLPDYPAWPQEVLSYDKHWLRIERVGNVFKAYASTDGATWYPYLFVQVMMEECIQIGLFMYNEKPMTTITASFENVTVTEEGMPLINVPRTVALGENLEAPPTLHTYPNPASSELTVDMSAFVGQPVSARLVDQYGQLRSSFQQESVDAQLIFPVNSFNPGIYYLEVEVSGQRYYQKVVVARP